MYCSIRSGGSCFYHSTSPLLSNNIGGSGKATDNVTQINIALREKGHFFSVNLTKCVNIFSMIV